MLSPCKVESSLNPALVDWSCPSLPGPWVFFGSFSVNPCFPALTWLHCFDCLCQQSRQPVRPKTTTGWISTRTKHWILKRWGAGERRKASSSGNRSENNRYTGLVLKLATFPGFLWVFPKLSRYFVNSSFLRGGMWTSLMKRRRCLRVLWWIPTSPLQWRWVLLLPVTQHTHAGTSGGLFFVGFF